MEGATAQVSLVRRREWGSVTFAACALVVAIVAWPLYSVAPSIGGDAEWVATLSYAAHHGIRFGAELVWTYGPLGFLETPYGAALYYSGTFTAAWLYGVLVQLLLATTLLAALRRALPLPLAALIAAAVLALQLELSLALGFAWCVLLVLRGHGDDDRPARAATPALPPVVLPLALGALTGVAVLGKLNQGLELLALALVALASTAVRRDALAFAGGLLVSAGIGWAATGQRVEDLWPYVRNSAEHVIGFPAAMGQSDPRGWTLVAALALVALALALAWDVGRGLPRRTRRGLLLLCFVYAGFDYKQGFVRQDALHMLTFFADMLVLLALLLVRARRRPLLLAALAGGLVVCGALMGWPQLRHALDPYENARAFADQAATLASPARQRRTQAESRRQIAGFYRLPPQLIAAVGRRPVMMWPYAYGDLAIVHDLRLRPFLGLEPYQSFTPRIDRLGAAAIASAQGPERILRTAPAAIPAVDGRFPTFEVPLATLEIFCRYREVARQDPWQLLARAPRRCGDPRPLHTVDARWGEPVAVPAARRPDALVLARIEGAGVHGLERLEELALRPRPRWIALDDARYRLVAATAPDGLLVSAPPAADYRQPFAMVPDAQTIAVGRDGGEPGGTLRYAFVEVPVRRFGE
ncbi:MAG TPA: hypothetical protein VF250_08035 [Conexibacter sp.]